MKRPVQEHPDYHEGFGHGLRGDIDNMRGPFDTTRPYCKGYDAGHKLRRWVQS